VATFVVGSPNDSRGYVFDVFGIEIASIMTTQKLQIVDQYPEPVGFVSICFKRQSSGQTDQQLEK
jgi:hypothetical protein